MTRVARKTFTLYSFSFAIIVIPIWLTLRPKVLPVMAPAAAPVALVKPVTPALLVDGEGPTRPPRFKVVLIRAGLSAEALASADEKPAPQKFLLIGLCGSENPTRSNFPFVWASALREALRRRTVNPPAACSCGPARTYPGTPSRPNRS